MMNSTLSLDAQKAQLYSRLHELESHFHQELYPRIFKLGSEGEFFLGEEERAGMNQDARKLAEKLHDMTHSRFKLLRMDKEAAKSLHGKKLLIPAKAQGLCEKEAILLKTSFPDAWRETFEAHKIKQNIREFVEIFNDQFYNLDEYRQQAFEIIDEIKRHSWEFNGAIPTVPKASSIPAARIGLFQLFQCNDPLIKEEALIALTELMEWDPLKMESAYHLVELQNGLLEEIRAAKAQNLNTILQRKLIKAYAISIECFLLHAGAGHLNAMADETKQENWTSAEEMEGLNISKDPEIKFWAKYAIQGIQYIRSDKSTLKSVIERLGKIAHAGILISIAVANPGDAAELITGVFNDLMGSIHHIHHKKDWFDQLLVLKKLCRFSILEPIQFRQISSILRDKKKAETAKELLYGTVNLIENVLMNTPSKEIQEEGLKLLLDYFTIEHKGTRKRVIAAFFNLTSAKEPSLNNTAFGILKMLAAAGKLPEEQNLPQKRIERGLIYENVLKFLLLRLAEIKSKVDISGHSLITLLCNSEEKKIVPPLLKCLAEICPAFQGPDPSGNTGFHVMIRQGYVSSLHLIAKGMINFVDVQENEQLYTALHDAVLMDSREAVQFLIELKANANLQDRQGNTPLHYAAEIEDGRIAARLLEGNANPNILNCEGKTALNLAIEMGNCELALLLLENGAKITEGAQGITPIMLAAKMKNSSLLCALIEQAKGKIEEKEALEIERLKNSTPHAVRRDNPFWKYHRRLRKNNAPYDKSFAGLDPNLTTVYLSVEVKLMTAVQKRASREALGNLIESGEPLHAADPLGQTALHAAVIAGDRRVLRYILEQKIQVNSQDLDGNTPLHLASFKRDYKSIQILLKSCADPTIKNNFGDTALLLACGAIPSRIPQKLNDSDIDDQNDIACIKALIKAGSDASMLDALGNNALHRASISGSADLIHYFLENHPEMIWQKNALGTIAVEKALYFCPSNESEEGIFANLIELHQKLYNSTKGHLTLGNILVLANKPFHFRKLLQLDGEMAHLPDETLMKHTPLHIAAMQGNSEILRIYIEKCLEVNQPDALGNTAAHLAAHYKHEEFLLLLRDQGCDFTVKNLDNRTPLHLAAAGKNDKVIRAIKNEKNLMEIDNRGDTALHIASRNSDEQVLEVFFPMVSTVNDDGNSPLHVACMYGNLKAVTYFIQKRENIELRNAFGQTPILLAAQEGHASIVSFLLKIGANIWSQDEEGESLLHKAVFNQHNEVIFKILEEEKSLIPPLVGGLARQDDRQGETPLHELPKTAPKGHGEAYIAILQSLLDAGADPEAVNQQGETFLHVVSYYGRLDLLKTLLKRKLKMSLIPRDVHGNTPLHKAVEGGHPEIVRELCRHHRKSGIKKKNDEGLTPLLLAVKRGFWEGAKILLSWHAKAGSLSDDEQSLFHLLLSHSKLDKGGESFLFDAANTFPKLLLNKDKKGQTILHIIAEQDHHSLLFALRFLPGKKKRREIFVRERNYEDLTAIDIADSKGHKKLATKIRNFPRESLGADYKSRTKPLKYIPFKGKY